MFKLSIGKRYLLSILSGLLFTLAFPFTGSVTPLVFIAWVPLLLVEQNLIDNNKKAIHVFIHAYLIFILFNIGTTWWIWIADEGGAIMAFIFNSLLMAITFLIYHLIKKRLPHNKGGWSLLAVWICFEYLHYNWELSHPWLTMGNFFSISPKFIQWYEFTGVLGGTLWVLLVNILVFLILKNWKEKQKRNLTLIGLFFGLTVPIIASIVIYFQLVVNSANHKTYEVVIVQPNIDAYQEKFSENFTCEDQIEKLIGLANQKITQNTALVLGPETSISRGFNEDDSKNDPILKLLETKLLTPNKKLSILIGASTYKLFSNKNSNASRAIPNGFGYYESYNSSLLMEQNKRASFIHKSKLVLGVEKIPFSSLFPFLEDLAIQNGGTSGSLGIEPHAKIFNVDKVKIGALVCYESIYGDFVTGQIRQGAQFISILTNDDWWGDTPGYRQHFSFAQLRAIENRRYIVRCANTGRSGIINERGEVLRSSNFSVPAVMKSSIPLMNGTTFYAKNGDYIGIISIGFSLLLVVLILVRIFKKKA
jgi:apolipoprotein N-acyltransferase